MDTEYRKTIRLRAEHVDCFRRLRLSVLMRLFQECCIAHTEELGMGRSMTLDRGLLWVINTESIEIARIPVYDEELTLVCRPGKTLHFFFPRQMAVLDAEGETIIKIGALWSLINAETRQLADPEEAGVIIRGENRPDDIQPPLLLREESLPNTVPSRYAAYSLVDINGHLNNASCIDIVLDRFSFEELKELSFRKVTCLFRKEIPAGTCFDLKWGRTGNIWHFRNEYFTVELGV